MEIEIANSKTIKEIQAEFNQRFPFLSLQFFGINSLATNLFSKENRVENYRQKLEDLYVLEQLGIVNVNGHLKVETLENQFLDEFQIPVQVYRKSGKIWLQTIETNHWTLSEQNRHGEEMDRELGEQKEDFDQFREQP